MKSLPPIGNSKIDEKESTSNLPPLSSKVVKPITNLLTSLKKEDKTSLITLDEANKLASLRLKNGEAMLTMEDKNFIYETVWLLNKAGYTKTYNFLNAGWENILGSNNIRKKILFENPLLERQREKFLLDLDIYTTKVEVSAGEKCRKCGSTETIALERVARSGDEIIAISITCLMCKHHWKAQ
jgi:DNA-directed RNA polymerase subunit M/transcription elongation factor TFIIS